MFGVVLGFDLSEPKLQPFSYGPYILQYSTTFAATIWTAKTALEGRPKQILLDGVTLPLAVTEWNNVNELDGCPVHPLSFEPHPSFYRTIILTYLGAHTLLTYLRFFWEMIEYERQG